jgi:hypothetical protein
MTQPLYPGGKSPQYYWAGSWVGPRATLEAVIKGTSSDPCWGLSFDSLIMRPVARPLYRITLADYEKTQT